MVKIFFMIVFLWYFILLIKFLYYSIVVLKNRENDIIMHNQVLCHNFFYHKNFYSNSTAAQTKDPATWRTAQGPFGKHQYIDIDIDIDPGIRCCRRRVRGRGSRDCNCGCGCGCDCGAGAGGGSYCQFDCKYNCDGNDECSRWMEDGTGLVWPGSSWRCFLLSIVIVVVIVDPLTIFATSHLAESLCSTLRGQHQNLLV